MTTTRSEHIKLLDNASVVLLDFDGPVCAVFSGLKGKEVAARMKTALPGLRGLDLEAETDPIQILHVVEQRWPEGVSLTEKTLTELECLAVESATPTPDAAEFLKACLVDSRRVVIVSNNSGDAVEKYLKLHDLAGDVELVIGREASPSLLKPSPHLIHKALQAVDSNAEDAVFIGDSVTDVEAAHAAGVACIGFANKPGKSETLRHAKADVIIGSMAELFDPS